MRGPRFVLIAIQARSTSTRLPNKVNLKVDGKPLLLHVVDACRKAENYLNRNGRQHQVIVSTAIVAPHGDPVTDTYKNEAKVFAPDVAENDVLSRYYQAAEATQSDWVVRITADCIYTVAYMVSRCVKAATKGDFDYVSNVRYRTFPEGMDVEVISRRLLRWLDINAKLPADREHVTSYLKNLRQLGGTLSPEFRVCHIMDVMDLSCVKTSIDTHEEYLTACENFRRLKEKRENAQKYGAAIQ